MRISITSEDGREKDIAVLQQGDCFGEMALLDGSNRSATATAAEDSETLVLHRQDFLDILRDHPLVAVGTTSMLTSRLRSVDRMVGDLTFLDVPTRLAKQLLDLAETYAGSSGRGDPVEIPLSHEELARLLGVSRETISRALNSFRRLGILTTSHRRITITDQGALERLVSF